MNLPVFLVVIPMGLLSGTYFPITHPVLATLSAANPLYHLAQTYRGLLLGGPVGGHLATWPPVPADGARSWCPLDLHLLRRRVLGD